VDLLAGARFSPLSPPGDPPPAEERSPLRAEPLEVKAVRPAPAATDPPRRLGAYIHFPWCLAKCPYCDFVSYGATKERIDHEGYADAVVRELETRGAALAGRRLETVFFGGGTPSLWEARALGRVLERVRRAASATSPAVEVTVECNPTSLDEDRARALLDAGVNRLSIGIQSLDDGRLRFLGRLHDAEGGLRALRDASRAGVRRLSADLIFGLPEQTPGEARDEVLRLADLGLEHLSAYQLTIEPGTRFGELARRGRLPLADDARVAESFLAIDEALEARGLRHYEVSNYAAPGAEARHNLGYWRGDEYLGLGCGAVGFTRSDDAQGRRGVRYRNEARPEVYLERTRQADAADLSESPESVDAPTLLRERIMLGLRLDDGVDLDVEGRDLDEPGWTPDRLRAATWLEGRGRIVRDGARVRIPRPAWLWTDDTAARLF
jgi:oxygen-independent coproporphyrinogen-3 oxidase